MNEPTTGSRVWLITGCSSGFGRALASHVLARGQRIIATARNPVALVELAARSPEMCRALALDVTDASQVKSVVTQAVHAFGQLDVVVNNAGYGLVGAFEELGEEQIARNFETNFFGALEVIRATLPILRAQRSGHIVNLSAAAVISNHAGFSIYGATKWALEGVSESLAAELKPLGIKVTIVQPGPFRTGFIGRSLERAESHIDDYDRTSGKFQRFLETMEGKQPGDPDKAAAAIFAAVESDAPPLRLVLGKYATVKTRQKLTSTENELTRWEHVGLPTEFNETHETLQNAHFLRHRPACSLRDFLAPQQFPRGDGDARLPSRPHRREVRDSRLPGAHRGHDLDARWRNEPRFWSVIPLHHRQQ